jgi:cytochrome c oxidase subunit 3
MATTSHGSSTGMKAPYHLVEPSPWPIIGSFAVAVLAFGAITYMHPSMWGQSLEAMFKGLGLWPVIVGIALVAFTMAGWWREVIKESHTPGLHTPVVRLGLRYGMFLFIASEVMFFVAFFWAFFHYALYPEHTTTGIWPPKGVLTFDPWDLPFLNTVILLTSGSTVTWAHHALKEGNRQHLILGLSLTVTLGILFTLCQAYEYVHAPFNLFGDLTEKRVYPSTFFLATGFHGFHVIVGTIFLAVCLGRAIKGHFTPEKHFGFEAAAWYWHFVDVVWLFLFCAIYWWGAGVIAAH